MGQEVGFAIDRDLNALAERFYDISKSNVQTAALALRDPVMLSLIEIASALGPEERDQLLFVAEDMQTDALRRQDGAQ